jgi:hypothetical protein
MDILDMVAQVVEREERSHHSIESVYHKLAEASRLRKVADLLEMAANMEMSELVNYDELGASKKCGSK